MRKSVFGFLFVLVLAVGLAGVVSGAPLSFGGLVNNTLDCPQDYSYTKVIGGSGSDCSQQSIYLCYQLDSGSGLNEGLYDFGGMFSKNGETCLVVNPATESCSCPPDFLESEDFDFRQNGGYNRQLYYCYKTNDDGNYGSWLFGGAYGRGWYGDSACCVENYLNVVTGEKNCPLDYESPRVITQYCPGGSSNILYFDYCIKKVAFSACTDADGDGWNFTSGSSTCGAPGDCDDGNVDVYPSYRQDNCSTSDDDNCDGLTNQGVVSPSGVVGYWDFHANPQTDFGTITDKSGNGLYAVFHTNENDLNKAISDGVVGAALSFDGVDDYAVVGDDDSLDLTTFSIEAWFKIDDLPVDDKTEIILSKGEDKLTDHYNYQMAVDTNLDGVSSLKCIFEDDTDEVYQLSYDINSSYLNRFVQFVCVFDGEWRMYIDGQPVEAQLYRGWFKSTRLVIYPISSLEGITPAIGGGDLYIGGRYETFEGDKMVSFFYGIIDEVVIYNRALTLAEIENNYAKGLVGESYIQIGDVCNIGDTFWADANGNPITHSEVGDVVKMVVKNTGLIGGTKVNFTIEEISGIYHEWVYRDTNPIGGLLLGGI